MSFALPRLYPLTVMLFGLLAMATPSQAWFWGKDHPSEDQVEQWTIVQVPDHFEALSVEIGSQETVQGLVEVSQARVKVVLRPTEDLYRVGGYLEDNTAFLAPTVSASSPAFTIYALVEAVPIGEGWDGTVIWDDKAKAALRKKGRPKSSFSPDAVIAESPAYLQRIAMIEKKKEEERRAEAARQARKQIVADYEGLATCGENVIEFDALDFDTKNGTARMVARVARIDEEWTEAQLTIEEIRESGVFRVFGDELKQEMRLSKVSGDVSITWPGCDVYLHEKGETPEEVTAARAVQERLLESLEKGPIPATLKEGDRTRLVGVEIVAISSRGFRIEIDQPQMLNGRFNNSDKVRTRSSIALRFVDPPAQTRIFSEVDGRGEPAIRESCAPVATLTHAGDLLIEAAAGYGCEESLRLKLAEPDT